MPPVPSGRGPRAGAVFVVAPLVELAVFVQVASWIGILNAIAAADPGVGRRRAHRPAPGPRGDPAGAGPAPGRQRCPAAELVNGLLILIAGLLLILPGFVSDVVGLLLLLPPTRAFVRCLLQQRYWVRVASGVRESRYGPPVRRVRNERDVIDVPGDRVGATPGRRRRPGARPTGAAGSSQPGVDQ